VKCKITPLEEPFTPKRVEIELETKEEAWAFRHVIGCWHHPENCVYPEKAEEVAREILDNLNGFPI
jgi:hypothetical protein